MMRCPMSGDVGACCKPDAVVPAHVLKKPDKPHSPARPPYEAVVQADAHQLRALGSLGVKEVEAVDHIACEVFGCAPAIVVIAIVVCLVGIRDDKMPPPIHRHPIRQFVVQAVAVVKEAAVLNE